MPELPHPTSDLFRLQRIFRDVFDNPGLTLAPGTSQTDIDGWDSVAQVKLVFAVEAEFGIRFAMEEVSTLRSAGEFMRRIEGIRQSADGDSGDVPDAARLLLDRARGRADSGFFEEAARELRYALSLRPPYAFFPACEKLLERILASGGWTPRRELRIALLSDATTSLFMPVLRAACFRRGIRAEIYAGLHGAWRQEILDPESGLHRFKPEIAVAYGTFFAAAGADDLDAVPDMLRKRFGCSVILCGGTGALPAGCSRLDAADSARPDAAEWREFQQYPATEALPRFAEAVAARCAAHLGLAAKVLAVDLDNTLWGGIAGETEDVRELSIGPEYAALQHHLRALHDRGVLLAACSKNNPEDAERPFREHPGMVLARTDFAAFTANWRDKAENLAAIAGTLHVGLDAVVFLDDNPVERDWVRQQLPEVEVVECGDGPKAMLAALRDGFYFDSAAVTPEDLVRHRSFEADAARRGHEAAGGGLDEFLRGLEMVLEVRPVAAASLERVAQLVNKTNQFNLTSRRHTAARLAEMAASEEWWCREFRLRDRFGDHGIIGVLLAEKTEERKNGKTEERAKTEETGKCGNRHPETGNSCWRVDSWLLSCRVLGRRLEEAMFAALADEAGANGVRELVGDYLPTPKNGLAAALYPRLGFRDEGGGHFRLDLTGKRPLECPAIRILNFPAPEID